MMDPTAAVDDESPGRIPLPSENPNNWGLGKYPAQIVAGIFKEWRSGDAKVDISDAKIKYVIDFEFAHKDEPTRKLLEDAVLRLPFVKPVTKARYDPYTGEQLKDTKPWTFDPATGRSYTNQHVDFDQGQFVEFLGDNMVWQLAKIRRIVKVVRADSEDPNDPDYDYFYNIGSESLIPVDRVRAPEEGIKLIFGFGPFIFQQWACLQLENTVRFQKNHELDMDSFSFEKQARDLWAYWMSKQPEYAALVDRIDAAYPGSKSKLIEHIVSPFFIMDELGALKDSYWKLEGISIYTYLAYLGSGWLTAFGALFIQFMVPAILLMTAVNSSSLFLDNNNYSGQDRFLPGEPFQTNWTQFCSNVGTYPDPSVDPLAAYFPQGKVMNICVLVLYAIRVLPMLFDKFASSAGGGDDALSRVNALRDIVWDQAEDTAWQQFGFKLAKYMDSLYVVILMTLMLFILFLTNDIFSIILNALALEFVYMMHEEIARADWWDPDGRFMRAAVIEMMLLDVLSLDALEDPDEFCEEFDLTKEQYAQAMKEAGERFPQVSSLSKRMARMVMSTDEEFMLPLRDNAQAKADASNPTLMSKKLRYYARAAELARQDGNSLAIANFVESTVQFGAVDQLMQRLGLKHTGIFSRFRDYHVWSRWSKLLYAAPHPKEIGKRTDPETGVVRPIWRIESFALCSNRIEATADGNPSVRSKGSGGNVSEKMQAATRRLRMLIGSKKDSDDFINYYKNSDQTALERFWDDIQATLFFGEMIKSLYTALDRGQYFSIPLRILDGFLQWFSYLYIMLYPCVLVIAFWLILACY